MKTRFQKNPTLYPLKAGINLLLSGDEASERHPQQWPGHEAMTNAQDNIRIELTDAQVIFADFRTITGTGHGATDEKNKGWICSTLSCEVISRKIPDKLPVIGQHFFQKLGSVQAIWAAACALVASDAVFNPVHLFLPLVGDKILVYGPSQQKSHPGGIGDGNIRRAGQAIAAASAKAAGKLAPVRFNFFLKAFGHGWRIFLQADKLIQLFFSLNSPDGDNMRVLPQETERGFGIGD